MPGGISLHAVDVSRGIPAEGMQVEILRLDPDGTRTPIAAGRLGANGTLDHPVTTGDGVGAGAHEAVFHIGAFFAAAGIACPLIADAPFRFNVFDTTSHYHLPIKFTPWGFSLYRGA